MKATFSLPSRIILGFFACSLPLHAAELSASDGAISDVLGASLGLSGTYGLAGVYLGDVNGNADRGSAYLFRNLDPAGGTATESVKLIASDGAANDLFGFSASLSGAAGLVGSVNDDIGANTNQGSAYLFRNLDTATGTITQSAKLTASDGETWDLFGQSVSLAGSIGVVSARDASVGAGFYQGAAYVFRNLDTASGSITQNAKLIASDGESDDSFGTSVSLSGTSAVVGALGHGVGANFYQGTAYLFRNLDTASGNVTESAKLIASDGNSADFFGHSVSHSGNAALVGADGQDPGGNSGQGAAYLYRNLDTASGTITEDAKLIASDGEASDRFGDSVSLSGNAALVGADYDSVANTNQGSAYYFQNLDSASGTVTETLKLTATRGNAYDRFGISVGLEGDRILIGASAGDAAASASGIVYSATVSSMTTLDVGNSTRLISGISFTSQEDWIIGQSTDFNQVTLAAGDHATVTADGKIIAIGQTAGSDSNTLFSTGIIDAETIAIGATGNFGNLLQLASTAQIYVTAIILANGNSISIEGDLTGFGALETYLDGTTLETWDGSNLTFITSENLADYINTRYSDGYTTFSAIPEPSAALLVTAGAIAAISRRRRNGLGND